MTDPDAHLLIVDDLEGSNSLYEFDANGTLIVPGGPLSGIGVATDAVELARLVDEWTLTATGAGVVDQAFEFWVMGRGAEPTEPRWSIIRDVLGWVD